MIVRGFWRRWGAIVAFFGFCAACVLAGALAGCAFPAGSGGAVDGGLLTGGASARWEPPPGATARWRDWNRCLRAQHAMRDGDACRCAVAYRELADLAEFARCHENAREAGDRSFEDPAATTGGRGGDPAGPPDLAALKRVLREDEGMHPGPAGMHVGYGHRLPLGLAGAEALLDVAARRALADAESAVGETAWRGLSAPRRLALASMAYQHGGGGLLDYDRMLAAIRSGDFAGAAAEMLDSDWARRDSPARARRLARTMRDG